MVIGRIPILDIQPVLESGRRPAKAVAGETFPVSATVFREGHEMLGAAAVLFGPDGHRHPLVIMHELVPGTDRYAADVTVTSEGLWRFRVEAWGDPIAHWRHDAGIKVPRGQDVDLMLAEGALLFDRAAKSVRPATVGSRRWPRGCATMPCRPGTDSRRPWMRRSREFWPAIRCVIWLPDRPGSP